MREFYKLEEAEEIRELLRQVVRQPPGEVAFAEATEQLLPELFGGLSIALARSFRAARLLVWERITTRGSAGAPRLAVVGASVSPHGSRSAGAYLRSPPQLPCESQDSDRGEYGQRQDGGDRNRHRKHQEGRGGGE